VQLAQVNAAARPRDKLTEMMMNQMNLYVQPSEIRKRVIAKLVLLQAADTIEKKPPRFMTSNRCVRFLGCTS